MFFQILCRSLMAWLALVVIARIAEARRYLEVDDDAMKDEGHHPAVIGGEYIQIEQAPWQVALYLDGGAQMCGGSIVASNVILTAQHCIHNIPVRMFISFGLTNIANVPAKNRIYVKAVIPFPNYDDVYFFAGKDVALLVLERNIPFSNKARPIKLASFEEYAAGVVGAIGSEVFLSGYGINQTVPDRMQDSRLKGASVVVSDIRELTNSSSASITHRHIAVGGRGEDGICFGDSGGPLVQEIMTPKGTIEPRLLGVASYVLTRTCGKASVFAGVWEYRDWIVQTMALINPPATASKRVVSTFVFPLSTSSSRMIYIPFGVAKAAFTFSSRDSRAEFLLQHHPGPGDQSILCRQRASRPCILIAPPEGMYSLVVFTFSGGRRLSQHIRRRRRKIPPSSTMRLEFANASSFRRPTTAFHERYEIDSIQPATIRYLPKLSTFPGDLVTIVANSSSGPSPYLLLSAYKGNNGPYAEAATRPLCSGRLFRGKAACSFKVSKDVSLVSIDLSDIGSSVVVGPLSVTVVVQRTFRIRQPVALKRVVLDQFNLTESTVINQTNIAPNTPVRVRVMEVFGDKLVSWFNEWIGFKIAFNADPSVGESEETSAIMYPFNTQGVCLFRTLFSPPGSSPNVMSILVSSSSGTNPRKLNIMYEYIPAVHSDDSDGDG